MKKNITCFVTICLIFSFFVAQPQAFVSAATSEPASYSWTLPVPETPQSSFWSIVRTPISEETENIIFNHVLQDKVIPENEYAAYDFYSDGKINNKDACVIRRMRLVKTFTVNGRTYLYNNRYRTAITHQDVFIIKAIKKWTKAQQPHWCIAAYDFNRNGYVDNADYNFAVACNTSMDIINIPSGNCSQKLTFEELESNIKLIRQLNGTEMTIGYAGTMEEIPYGAVVYYNGSSYIYHKETLVLPTDNPNLWRVHYFTEYISFSSSYYFVYE